MIQWKDGKIDRAKREFWPSEKERTKLYDTIDSLVTAMCIIANADHAYRDGAQHCAQETLRKIGFKP